RRAVSARSISRNVLIVDSSAPSDRMAASGTLSPDSRVRSACRGSASGHDFPGEGHPGPSSQPDQARALRVRHRADDPGLRYAISRPLFPDRRSLRRLRRGDDFSLSLGGAVSPSRTLRLDRDARLPGDSRPRILLRLEAAGPRLGLISANGQKELEDTIW